MNNLPNIISVNSRYQHLSFVIVHENPANHGELQSLARINSTVSNTNGPVMEKAISTEIKFKNSLELEQNFTSDRPPSGRHFYRTRDTLFEPYKENPTIFGYKP